MELDFCASYTPSWHGKVELHLYLYVDLDNGRIGRREVSLLLVSACSVYTVVTIVRVMALLLRKLL